MVYATGYINYGANISQLWLTTTDIVLAIIVSATSSMHSNNAFSHFLRFNLLNTHASRIERF